MADELPQVGDRVLYRGRYREVIGWQDESREEITEERGSIIVYQNPETERNTYSREEDLEWSEHFGAWYPTGVLLSRAECVVYAALPSMPGGDVPQAGQHERAARLMEDADLTLESLSEGDRGRVDAKIQGYWGESDETPSAADVFAEAREMRDHRQNVREE